MPRIDPLKLLICLSQLLAPNGGIRGSNDVKRLTGLMGKFCKKLVSKCIYIQILKCTETELLGEFMSAGGWTLTYTWLSDGIQSKNWPLVQEILELMLLCPVDVQRLKINSAPKLVKQLSKEGGVEAVRILASKLVEQWLKIVKGETCGNAVENSAAGNTATPAASNEMTTTSSSSAGFDAIAAGAGAEVAAMAAEYNTVNVNVVADTSAHSTIGPIDPNLHYYNNHLHHNTTTPPTTTHMSHISLHHSTTSNNHHHPIDEDDQSMYVDPNALIDECTAAAAAAELNGSVELHEVPDDLDDDDDVDGGGGEEAEDVDGVVVEASGDVDEDDDGVHDNSDERAAHDADVAVDADVAKTTGLVFKFTMKDGKKVVAKVEGGGSPKDRNATTVSVNASPARQAAAASVDEEASSPSFKTPAAPKSSNDREKSKSSSSGGSKSSSSSSSKDRKTTSSSSSSSKRPSSSSSSSTHHRSSSSSSSSAHRSSSSSGRSDRDRHRSSNSSKSSSSSSVASASASSREKSRDKTTSQLAATQAEKDKETLNKVLATNGPLTKLGKIPRKPRDEHAHDHDMPKPSAAAAAAPAAKRPASISIETRSKDVENRPKTVKLFNSKFRSHGLAEEAPPPPSRRGAVVKKPTPSASGTVIPSALSALSGTAKRRSASPPADGDKKPRLDLTAAVNHVDKPGSIKLISPKPKPSVLMDSDMFMDALSAATSSKKDASRKRKRKPSPTREAAPAATSNSAATAAKLERLSSTDAGADSDAGAGLDTSHTSDTDTVPPPATTAASATAKDEQQQQPGGEEPPKPAPTPAAPLMKFYQDTLETRRSVTPDPEQEDGSSDSNTNASAAAAAAGESINFESDADKIETPASPTASAASSSSDATKRADDLADDDDAASSSPPPPAIKGPGPGCGPDGPPGVLIRHRARNAPKKKLTWRPHAELEEVRYFELDETERCNVTKAPASFGDMKQSERSAERDGFAMQRKLGGGSGGNPAAVDTMREQMAWSPFLFEVEDVPRHLNGAQSAERAVQQQRELGCLKALYFNRLMVPDSAAEPDAADAAQQQPHQEALVIPLDDVTGNTDAVTDFTGVPWPEARGSPLPPQLMGAAQQQQMAAMLATVPTAPLKQMGGGVMGVDAVQMQMHVQQQQQMPAYGVGPYGSVPPNAVGGFIAAVPAPAAAANSWSTVGAPMPVGAGLMDGPPPGFQPQQQQQLMMNGGGPMPPFIGGPPPSFRHNERVGGGGGQPWMRGVQPHNRGGWRGGMNNNGGGQRPPWANSGGGGAPPPPNARTRLCKSFAKGYCRNGDACNFLHPGQNGPMY